MGKFADLEREIINSYYKHERYGAQTTWEWWKEYAWDWQPNADDKGSTKTPLSITLSDGSVVTPVDSYGGEGQGSDYWVVIKVTSPDGTERFFHKNGHYSSYSYEEDYFEYCDEMTEVNRAERLQTFWEVKND